jgi:NAD(P)-dependent dehydrogenase (short-subunit alcohol dehydrogenase family)
MSNQDSLRNKVAIVTGAGSGIGRACAEFLAERGAAVVVADVDEAGAHETVAAIAREGRRALFVRCDVSNEADGTALVDAATRAYGGLDIAVNNAGIAGALAPVHEMPVSAWQRVVNVNLTGAFLGMRAQIPALLARGGGSIINVSSILGQVGFRGACAYTAAKHGLIGLTQTAALEYAERGIRVNAVGPGFIKTPMLDKNLDAQALAGIAQLHPMKRLGEANEVAELVAWLASPAASFVTGAYLAIDGGYLAQ